MKHKPSLEQNTVSDQTDFHRNVKAAKQLPLTKRSIVKRL